MPSVLPPLHHHRHHHHHRPLDTSRLMVLFLGGAFFFASLNLLVYFPSLVQSLIKQPPPLFLKENSMAETDSSRSSDSTLVVATRFHLGKAAVPPSQEDLEAKLRTFGQFCSNSCTTAAPSKNDGSPAVVVGVIAVDAEERISGYDLVEHIEKAVAAVQSTVSLHVLPVQPWGQFAPALNALIGWASLQNNSCRQILFASAETTASAFAVQSLQNHLTSDTLVAGIVLPGHDYQGPGKTVDLNGRTTPWNTLALWDLRKLALTGFQLVSEGLQPPAVAGVEEVVVIAVLQKILGGDNAKAKLVQVDGGGVEWDQTFGGDPARKQWHEEKMQSKISRAATQLELLGLKGVVHHC